MVLEFLDFERGACGDDAIYMSVLFIFFARLYVEVFVFVGEILIFCHSCVNSLLLSFQD